MTLLALLIWRCSVYMAWQCLLGFRRAPWVQSARHVQLSSVAVDPPSSGLVIRHPLFLFTPAVTEAMDHTWPCPTLKLNSLLSVTAPVAVVETI